MKDDLEQLLRRADKSAPAPALAIAGLPERIRRSVRRQRRISACGFATLVLLAASIPLLMTHRSTPQQIAGNAPASTVLNVAIHERTAALLERFERESNSRETVTDDFLRQLQHQRDRAALVLLQSADSTHDSSRDRILHRTVELFPDTPAASMASAQLKEPNLPKRQS